MSDYRCESIIDAAANGDMEFLEKAYEDNNEDLRSYLLGRDDTKGRNLLHVGVQNNRYVFLFEALEILSSDPSLVIDLICQSEEENGCNPLHFAAMGGNIYIVKLLVNAYATALDANGGNNQVEPPWLTTSSTSKHTPLRCSMLTQSESHEDVAMYLVLWELRHRGQARYPVDRCSTMILDSDGTSVLFNAMQNGFSRFVEQLLESDLPYSYDGRGGETPLHYAFKCNERVFRLLLEKHPELVRKLCLLHETVLDKAVENDASWLVELMLIDEEIEGVVEGKPWIEACRKQIWHRNKTTGDTPLHVAAQTGNIEILRIVTQAYRSAIQEEATKCDGEVASFGNNDFLGWNPLRINNFEEDVPLVVALRNEHDECGVILAEHTYLVGVPSGDGDIDLFMKALLVAAENGCKQSLKMIMGRTILNGSINLLTKFRKTGILSPCFLKVLTYLAMKYPVRSKMLESEEMEFFLEVLPDFLRYTTRDAKTHLIEAVEGRKYWLIRLLLDSHQKLIKDSAPAWRVACEKGNQYILYMFIDHCGCQEFSDSCRDIKQTPLHHIRLLRYGDYKELLKNPVLEALKNDIDSDGATPLHRAIQCNDLELTKVLLETEGIDVNIEDSSGTTALVAFENQCHISKRWLEEYMKLIELPAIQLDRDGATPLHRAIRRENHDLTKALLETRDIQLRIPDKNGITAFNLLEIQCRDCKSWGKLCREVEQDSTIKQLKDLFTQISFEGMQNNLSVVAALVTTITFAAGITIPGGLPSENTDGSPVLAKRAAFLVFSVSNTIGMCSSIMVLILLLGPLMWDPHPSQHYVNSSLILLLTSIGCTILAFMTGVYATMIHEVKWNAIFVLASCSFTFFVACVVLLCTYSSRCKKQVLRPCRWVKDVYKSIAPANEASNSGATRRPLASAAEQDQQQQNKAKSKARRSPTASPTAGNQLSDDHVVNLSQQQSTLGLHG